MSSSIIEKISEENSWKAYYAYKSTKEPPDSKLLSDIQSFIEKKSYEQIPYTLNNKENLPYPTKKLINKSNGQKKRAVYIFPEEFNMIMKCLAYQLKDYDYLFAPNLYSFRRNKTANDAWSRLKKIKNLKDKYIYKVDISNYFCSVNVFKLLPELKALLKENDSKLFCFLESILLSPYAIQDGKQITESKGIIPGAPFSAFLANIYLRDLDWSFYCSHVEYMRYSDDILVIADDETTLLSHVSHIKEVLSERGLNVNPDKESFIYPGQKWDFLGFSYFNGKIDISDVAFKKLKAKMRRKSRALVRWSDKKNLPGIYAAKAFVKQFNAKLYNNPVNGELTWTRWYFPVINTDETLKKIDAYMLDCIRFLNSGKRTKTRYNFRYDDIKALGYRSLVNEFYSSKDTPLQASFRLLTQNEDAHSK